MILRIFIKNSLLWMFVISISAAWGWDYGLNRVQSSSEDPAAETGYGPGWVGLTYKPNGPIVGYLFAEGFQFSDGSIKTSFDHMDIRGTTDVETEHPTIDRWPWGYAHGSFQGCAYGYGTSKFAMVGDYSSSSCASGPSVSGDCSADPWWHSENVFCTDNGSDPVCSPVGVWSECKTCDYGVCSTLTVYSLGCQAYGNIGAAAAYGSGSPVPTHPLGSVPSGEIMDLRYVTKDRQYVMAKWHSGELISGIEWAFFPRSCVSETQPSDPQPGGCGGDSCGMGSCVISTELVPDPRSLSGTGPDREVGIQKGIDQKKIPIGFKRSG
jgi:hypothetical protein